MSQVHAQRPRIGLIGTAGFARVHGELLLDPEYRDRLRTEAVVVPPGEEETEMSLRLQAAGARTYRNFPSFIEGERGRLDLCIIPTGIHWHARMAVAALEAGMHVLVEKPLAGCMADARSIRAAEEKTGNWVAVAYQDAYTGTAEWLGKELLAGRIGTLRRLKFLALWPREEAYYTRNSWAGKMRAEGIEIRDFPFNNAMAHFIHLAFRLVAPAGAGPDGIRILGADKYRARDIETHDTAVAIAESDSGIRFWFGGSHAGNELRHPELTVRGSSGTAAWGYEGSCVVRPDSGEPVTRRVPDHHAARRQMLDAVLKRLEDGRAPVCDTTSAIRQVSFIEDFNRCGSTRPLPAVAKVDTLLIEAFKKECLLHELVPAGDASSPPSPEPNGIPIRNQESNS